MKKRILGGVLVLSTLIISLFMGNNFFTLVITLIATLGLKELIDIKYHNNNLNFIKLITYVFLIIMLCNGIAYNIDEKILIIMPLIGLLIPLIYYNDTERYNINDSFYFLGILYFMYLSFRTIISIEEVNIHKCIYIFVIAFITDTYAYIGGKLIGEHKLTSISPKKTAEGSVTGAIMGVYASYMYYINYIGDMNHVKVFVMTLILTILSELGDLIFSSIKRYFNTKDYSNLIPGHGGILDRFDSVIFVALGISILLKIF